VHRDIKPENILLTGAHCLVADFGVARALQTGGPELTGTGIAIGTPTYMSPEQSVAEPSIDGRSDLYSLACVLYEMLTGEPPYTGTSAQAIIAKRLMDPIPSARRLRESVPVTVDSALHRALAKSPADRFSSMDEFVGALRAPAEKRKLVSWRIPAIAVITGLAVTAILLRVRQPPDALDSSRSDAASQRLIAVFPFKTIGDDTSQQYFTAGMTEEITGQLSRLEALRVVGSAVAQGYGSSGDNLGRLAADLGVGSAVMGTVRLAANRVRIAVQLVDTRSSQTVWSEQYDRGLADVFEVQSDVARQIADALQARLTPYDAVRLQRPVSVSPAAHDLYLRAGALAVSDAVQGPAGMALLHQAISLDSTYSEAWSALAYRYYFASVYGSRALRDSARSMAERAIELRPELPEGHVILGAIASEDGRLSAAREAYVKALLLDPSDVPALADLSDAELTMGRYDEGLRLAIRAAPLGGNDVLMYYHVGNALVRLGDDAASEAWLSAGARREVPSFYRVEILLSLLDVLRGRDSVALTRARQLVAREPTNYEARANLAELAALMNSPDAEELTGGIARQSATSRSGGLMPESFGALHGLTLHRSGRREAAESLWVQALMSDKRDIETGHENPNRPLQTAALHAIRGDSARALDWLDRAYSAGWKNARILAIDPFFTSLRGSPRFQALLGRMTEDVSRMRAQVKGTTDSLKRISLRDD
jgi:serine/threonine-protein kinase